MAGTGATFSDDLLLLIFQGTTIANLAINATSSPITQIFASLHTADPVAGDQTTSEAAYTSYARVGVSRNSGGWTVSGRTVVPAAAITFPAATGGSETETFAGLGKSTSGAGELYFCGAISPTIAVSNGVTPSLGTATVLTLS